MVMTVISFGGTAAFEKARFLKVVRPLYFYIVKFVKTFFCLLLSKLFPLQTFLGNTNWNSFFYLITKENKRDERGFSLTIFITLLAVSLNQPQTPATSR